eukprot:jgi/Psemu1/301723/fgenesh1_kg.43_\
MILNRRRFLAKYGLDDITSSDERANPLKTQMIGLLHAIQYLKPVVIIANLITIIFELILGGS